MDGQDKLKALLPAPHATHNSTAPTDMAAMWSSMGNMQASSMMMDPSLVNWHQMIPQSNHINSTANTNINSNPYYNLYPANA